MRIPVIPVPPVLKKKRSRLVIENPFREAGERFGAGAHLIRAWGKWEQDIVCCPTARFEHLGRGFYRHCGPTAITALLLSMHRRYGVLGEQPPSAEQVFLKTAEIGRKTRIYWNADFLGRFGGTGDIMTGIYLLACFRAFHIKGMHVRGRYRVIRSTVCPALDRGSLLYLQLQRDACYGSHHLLCFGAVELADPGNSRKELYLKVADGWSETPRFLPVSDLRFSRCWEIRYEPEKKA